jgi:transcriptional regulator with XRE-family HTH domain
MGEFTYLSANLRFFRQLLGLSQYELARLASAAGQFISQDAISRYEHGQQPPDSSYVGTLAQALGVSPASMLRRPRVVRSPEGLRPVVVSPLQSRPQLTGASRG